VSYGYTNGFLTAVPSYATSISYSVNTMPYQIAHANGVSATYGLDSNRIQRVAGVTTTGASTNNLNLTPFAYDGADNIKSIGSQTFVYDKVSRLTSATIVTGGTSKTQAASYDAFGFILSLNTNGTNQTFTPVSGTNHISGSNYDGAGAMTGWGVYIYTWDQLGKMRTVTGTGVNHTYLYTADGERISDRDSLAATTTLTVRGSDGKVLRIYAKSGSTWSWSKDYVYQQGMLLGSIDASATKYFDLDHLGTPRLITGSGGTTLAFHDYYPFGQEATSATQDTERMKFTGHERDLMGTSAQTDDLDYMHARYDNPNIARFLSPDLLRGDPHQPQSFNLFAYVQNNPMNYVDPLGLIVCDGPNDPRCQTPLIVIEMIYCEDHPEACPAGGAGGVGPPPAPTPPESITPCPVSAQSVNTYLQGKDSPMAGEGKVFMDAGRAFNVDPRFIVALGGAETTFGLHITWGQYNAWNWGWNTSDRANSPFASWAEGINTVSRGIARSYLDRGRTNTTSLYLGTYCQGPGCSVGLTNLNTSLTDQGGDPNSLHYPCQGSKP